MQLLYSPFRINLTSVLFKLDMFQDFEEKVIYLISVFSVFVSIYGVTKRAIIQSIILSKLLGVCPPTLKKMEFLLYSKIFNPLYCLNGLDLKVLDSMKYLDIIDSLILKTDSVMFKTVTYACRLKWFQIKCNLYHLQGDTVYHT